MINRRTTIILLSTMLLVATTKIEAQVKNFTKVTDALNKAFSTKDTSGLSVHYAADFSIAGSTGIGAQKRLHQIINQSTIKSIQESKLNSKNSGNYNQVEIVHDNGKTDLGLMELSSEGKLRGMSYFDGLYGMKIEEKSRLIAQVPFENQNGSIILTVQINSFEKPLRLLFDTGADGMAVGQQLADEIGLKVTRENNASVVGGNQVIQVSDKNVVRLNELILEDMGIAIFPEFNKGNIDGIIGNSILRRYIVHINYDKSVLSLYSFGKHKYLGIGQKVAVSMPSGVMLVKGELEIVKDKIYSGNFVFDTGASYDLICFRPFVRQNRLLISGFKPETQGSTVSMGVSSPTFMGSSHQFSIFPSNKISNLPVTLMGGGANEMWDPGVDGSIGVRLLSRYNMTINLAENEIFFSPNKMNLLPQDFLLKGYLMGWDNESKLKILGTSNLAGAESKFEKGQHIESINGHTSSELSKNPRLISKVKDEAGSNTIQIKLPNNKLIQL